MKWAVETSLIQGLTADTLKPKNNATRAEIATIINRYCSQFVK